jgi:hypothetical protein
MVNGNLISGSSTLTKTPGISILGVYLRNKLFHYKSFAGYGLVYSYTGDIECNSCQGIEGCKFGWWPVNSFFHKQVSQITLYRGLFLLAPLFKISRK